MRNLKKALGLVFVMAACSLLVGSQAKEAQAEGLECTACIDNPGSHGCIPYDDTFCDTTEPSGANKVCWIEI